MDKKTVEHIESLIGENERLRALLTEAREVVAAVAESGNPDDALRQRIDAALAEPVQTPSCAKCDEALVEMEKAGWPCRLVEAPKMITDLGRELGAARRERDEARAKVERLRSVEAALLEQRETHREHLARADERTDEAKTKAKDAYQRGAEAMREAAAQACVNVRSAADVDHWIWVGCREGCVDAIRALPLPEDA